MPGAISQPGDAETFTSSASNVFFFYEKNDSVRLCLLSTLDSGRMPKLKPKWQVSASLTSPMFAECLTQFSFSGKLIITAEVPQF